MNIAYLIITILSLLGTILAWLVKLKWAKEFEKAKNAVIASKEAQMELLKEQLKIKDELINIKNSQIEHLNSLSPPKLHEYYSVTKKDLEAYIDILKSELDTTKSELNNLIDAINRLDSKDQKNKEIIDSVKLEKTRIEHRLKSFMDSFKNGLIDLFKEEENDRL